MPNPVTCSYQSCLTVRQRFKPPKPRKLRPSTPPPFGSSQPRRRASSTTQDHLRLYIAWCRSHCFALEVRNGTITHPIVFEESARSRSFTHTRYAQYCPTPTSISHSTHLRRFTRPKLRLHFKGGLELHSLPREGVIKTTGRLFMCQDEPIIASRRILD
jgi:hypothetical protein